MQRASPIVGASQAVEYRLLPIAKLLLQLVCDLVLDFDEVILFTSVGAKVEQLGCRLTSG
jgi:hypothetical protein